MFVIWSMAGGGAAASLTSNRSPVNGSGMIWENGKFWLLYQFNRKLWLPYQFNGKFWLPYQFNGKFWLPYQFLSPSFLQRQGPETADLSRAAVPQGKTRSSFPCPTLAPGPRGRVVAEALPPGATMSLCQPLLPLPKLSACFGGRVNFFLQPCNGEGCPASAQPLC